jgi:hypothetical protein
MKMGQHMQICIMPRHEATIVPDEAVTVIEGIMDIGSFLPRDFWLVWPGSKCDGEPPPDLTSHRTANDIQGCEISQYV